MSLNDLNGVIYIFCLFKKNNAAFRFEIMMNTLIINSNEENLQKDVTLHYAVIMRCLSKTFWQTCHKIRRFVGFK